MIKSISDHVHRRLISCQQSVYYVKDLLSVNVAIIVLLFTGAKWNCSVMCFSYKRIAHPSKTLSYIHVCDKHLNFTNSYRWNRCGRLIVRRWSEVARRTTCRICLRTIENFPYTRATLLGETATVACTSPCRTISKSEFYPENLCILEITPASLDYQCLWP